MEVVFEALKELHELPKMALDELVELNTKLSQLREQAGGELREAIYTYALEVNEHITNRAMDREEDIRANIAADPERAALHQTVSPVSVKSEEGFFLGKGK